MMQQYSDRRFRLSTLASACFVALATAGCGGGSSGGGGGGGNDPQTESSLSSEEQVALAAFSSGGTANTGSAAADQASDEEPQSQSTAGAMTFSTSDSVTCNEGGEWWMHENRGGDFALDQVDFLQTGIFSNEASLPTGSDLQVRANDCRINQSGITSRTDGAIDNARAEFTGDREIAYVVFGGFDGSDPSIPEKGDVNVSEPYIAEVESSDFPDISLRMRGEFWSCVGCLEEVQGSFVADLASVSSGNPLLDVAVAGRFEAIFDNFTTVFGDVDGSAADRFTFVSAARVGGANFVVDGRVAYADADRPECSFDVTYATAKDNAPFIAEFGNDDVIPTAGGFEVTLNSGNAAGETFDVNFATGNDDTVEVNGTEYNRNDLVDENGCSVDPDAL